ncbi:MAG: hypothetical protein PWQ28_222 [Candidatus Woesearchaeota archaeon]|nr:hypothetical protein [Candidatus Woesearchaeota archaeon]
MADENTKKEMSKEEEIGYHKGALSTLSKEREELLRIVSIVEQLMHMHVKSLNELGVKLWDDEKKDEKGNQKKKDERKPIDELLN